MSQSVCNFRKKSFATGESSGALAVVANESGLITLDFIFALMVSIGFMMVFFSVAVTLSLVEVGQYVTYATARAYAGANETEGMQQDLARSKYAEVMKLSAIKTFLGSDWMKLGAPQLGDFTDEYNEPADRDNAIFVGARITIDAKLLHLQVPFLGTTADDSGVGQATLNAYLMREVTTSECREQFNRMRYQQLKTMGNYSSAPGATAKLITDNGC